MSQINPKAMTVIGWALTLLPAAMLCMGAFMMLSGDPKATTDFQKAGYPEKALFVIGVVAALSIVLYVVPKTSLLGAILLTGYLGGAVNHHVRAGDPIRKILAPAIFGIIIWLGVYLRDPKLRKLVPLRSK